MAEHTSTLADDVENRLMKYISERNLHPGESLPKEEELAVSLGVSRHILREGLRGLKVIGLIEAKKKSGMVLRHPAVFSGLGKLAAADLLETQDYRELMEMRVALELGMCNYIFQRKTPERIRALRKKAGDPGRYVHALSQEVEFHSELVRLANNRTVDQIREILALIFDPASKEADRFYADRNGVTTTHVEICDVLESGTEEEFRKVMELHFFPYRRRD